MFGVQFYCALWCMLWRGTDVFMYVCAKVERGCSLYTVARVLPINCFIERASMAEANLYEKILGSLVVGISLAAS